MPEAWKGAGIAVLEWEAWDQFLVSYLLPEATRIPVSLTSGEKKWHEDFTDYEAVLPQINLSKVDSCRQFQAIRGAAQAQRVQLLNSSLVDIRKSTVQRILKARGLNTVAADAKAPPEARLIIKTDLNHGGVVERRLPAEVLVDLGISLPPTAIRGAYDYLVRKRHDVPSETWSDSTIAIEYYIENAADQFHRAYIAGDHIVIVNAICPGVIKKLNNSPGDLSVFLFRSDLGRPKYCSSRYGILPEDVLRQLGRFISLFPIDYAAIDIVNDGSSAYIVDVNSTPWAGASSPMEEALEFLRLGIARLMRE